MLSVIRIVVGGLLVGSVRAIWPLPDYTPYVHAQTYNSSNFFTSFDFFTGSDPTHGFVEYVDIGTAAQAGMIGYAEDGIYMAVDNTTNNVANGRRSVRVTSQRAFTHGLFIADIKHMPDSTCGVWPAFWMFGPGWPDGGEIDIIEGVNTQTSNQVTLHTSDGCWMNNAGTTDSTKLLKQDCCVNDNNNAGCAQVTADKQSYGDGFNANHGGTYATEWTSDHISVWFFPRWKVPKDIRHGVPNPSRWGAPMARFNGGQGCNIDSHFYLNNLVFDTTFCGDWAGNAWSQNPECAALAPTCESYVANNPKAFKNAYWLVSSVKVYEQVHNGTWPQKTR